MLVIANNFFAKNMIIARCTLSPEDAMYCARFIEYMHESCTPGFNTVYVVDVVSLLVYHLLGLSD